MQYVVGCSVVRIVDIKYHAFFACPLLLSAKMKTQRCATYLQTTTEAVAAMTTNININISLNYADLNKAFTQACTNGSWDIVAVLAPWVDIHANDDKAVRMASWYGRLQVVDYLVVSLGADIHAEDDFAVRIASQNGHLAVVKYLVEECGADIHAVDDYAVRYASDEGRLEVVKYLVQECGANIHAEKDFAVRIASQNGHLEVVKYLVEECGADIHSTNDYAVRLASRYGHLDVVKYLVSVGGADIHACDDFALQSKSAWSLRGGRVPGITLGITQINSFYFYPTLFKVNFTRPSALTRTTHLHLRTLQFFLSIHPDELF